MLTRKLAAWLTTVALSTGTLTAQAPGDIAYAPIGSTVDVLLLPIDFTPSEGLYNGGNVASFGEAFSLFIAQNSYGETSVAITQAPVIQLPHSAAYYKALGAEPGLPNGIGTRTRTRLREATVARAKQMGINVDAFDREFILSRPQAWVGRSAHGSGNYRTLWISEEAPLSGSLWAHEFGHSSGWIGHANFWQVEPGEPPTSPNGSIIQYGDRLDTMGDSSTFHQFNPWNKLRAGWLQAGDVVEASSDGTYTIQSLENAPISVSGSLPSALRIRIDPQRDYWVFHRSTEPLVAGGLLITRSERRNTTDTQLLDMAPATPAWDDAELLPGGSFTDPDPVTGFQLDFVDFVGGNALIQIDFAGGTQQPAIDNLPTIDVTEPARGLTLRSAVYASKMFSATAFDSDVGTYNGAGIASVLFEVGYYDGDEFEEMLSGTDTQAPYQFCLDMSSLTTRIYTLLVTATSDGSTGTGGAVQTAEFDFLLDARPGTGGPLLIDCYLPH